MCCGDHLLPEGPYEVSKSTASFIIQKASGFVNEQPSLALNL